MLDGIAEFAVEQKFDSYLGPMLLAELERFPEALELVPLLSSPDKPMCYQMLAKSLVKRQAPSQVIADCLRLIDKPSRLEWALKDNSYSLGRQNRPAATTELGDLLGDLEPKYRALYWSGVAFGLARRSR